MSQSVVVPPQTIPILRLAIHNEGVTARESLERISNFFRERMLPAIAGTVTPPDFSYRAFVRSREGVGLGLPLAKSFVELHGGVLQVDSAPGRGTTVMVNLPPWRAAQALG